MTTQKKLSLCIIALCVSSSLETLFYLQFTPCLIKIGEAVVTALLIVFFSYESSRLIKDIS
jgi:hypothetical protein